MVAGCETESRLVRRVAEIYRRLDLQIHDNGSLSGVCRACGKCCDFDDFDHRLFVTTPELMYLAAKLAGEKMKPMNGGRCPYNIDGECSIYEYRFAGCRVFCCKGDADFQSGLSESAVKKFKSACAEFGVPYKYLDLPKALNELHQRYAPEQEGRNGGIS
jgi:Fe-S-cluster containining protein